MDDAEQRVGEDDGRSGESERPPGARRPPDAEPLVDATDYAAEFDAALTRRHPTSITQENP